MPAAPPSVKADLPAVIAVDDPHRSLENLRDPATAAWMKAQGDQARSVLRAISGRAALREKLDRYGDAAADRITRLTLLRGDLVFYGRIGAQRAGELLVLRQGLQGRETTVFDPAAARPRSGKPPTLGAAAPSSDGRLLAVVLMAAGAAPADSGVLRVLDTRTGRALGRDVDRVPGGSAISWLPDGSGLFFNRRLPAAKGTPPASGPAPAAVVFMKPGGSDASIRTIVRAGQDDVNLPQQARPQLDAQPDGRLLLRAVADDTDALAWWHGSAAAVLSGKADWRPLAVPEDQVAALALQGNRYWALTRQGAPRLKVVSGRLDEGRVAAAAVVVPEGDRALTGLAVASDALYLSAREDHFRTVLLRRPHTDDATVAAVQLPVLGDFQLDAHSARTDEAGVLLRINHWTRAPQVHAVTADGRVSNTGLQASGPYDAPGDVIATEVLVNSDDGAVVPMTIVHKADVALEGQNPLLLVRDDGQGRSEEPRFNFSRLAWLESGGVWAVAHARDGTAPLAQHARDFAACAAYLTATRWTNRSRLGIGGRGASGVPVALAMVEKPDLFAAAILDAVPWDGVLAPAAQPRAGLPAVLVMHSAHDPQLPVWHSMKLAARLQAAGDSGGSASRKPVLLRLADEAVPGREAEGARPALDEEADRWTFLRWQMGLAAGPATGAPAAAAR